MEPYKLDDFLTRSGLSKQHVLDAATSAHKKNPHDYRLDILIELLTDMIKDKLSIAVNEIVKERKRRIFRRELK